MHPKFPHSEVRPSMMKVGDIYLAWKTECEVSAGLGPKIYKAMCNHYISNMYAVILLHYLYREEMINKPFYSFPKPPVPMTTMFVSTYYMV
jgi:hypothetical protein